MPAFNGHHWYAITDLIQSRPDESHSLTTSHSPICTRIGDKRCLALEHYVDCSAHPGSYHSRYADCIKCVEAERREERRKAIERQKENNDPTESEMAANKANKKAKKGKFKPIKQKSMKQIRKEQRALKQSASGSTTPTTDGSVVDDLESD